MSLPSNNKNSSLTPQALISLYEQARHDSYQEILLSLGENVTGCIGYLAAGCFTVYATTPAAIILSSDGNPVPRQQVQDVPDRVLNHLGLRIGRLPTQISSDQKTELGVFAVRLGLVSRILDMAFVHLKDRISFGQPTLRHQLVKATFAEVSSSVVRLSEQMLIRGERALIDGVYEDHREVSELSLAAEKMMGGHGYLLGGTHSVSYLSMILFSIYASRK